MNAPETGAAAITRTRFAPSPIRDPHLGNARTALPCRLRARRDVGCFVPRVEEDTHAERRSPAALQRLRADLRCLDLDRDEGPERGGDHGRYVQSARSARYKHDYARLSAAGLAYKCFCPGRTLSLMRKRQAAAIDARDEARDPRHPRMPRRRPGGERRPRSRPGST